MESLKLISYWLKHNFEWYTRFSFSHPLHHAHVAWQYLSCPLTGTASLLVPTATVGTKAVSSGAVMDNIPAGPIAGTLPLLLLWWRSSMKAWPDFVLSSSTFTAVGFDTFGKFCCLECITYAFDTSSARSLQHPCSHRVRAQTKRSDNSVVGFIWSVDLNITCEHSGSWFPSCYFKST